MRRGKTSTALLRIDWHAPLSSKTPRARQTDGRTRAQQLPRALPFSQAFHLAAAGDPRPLLILRECEGTTCSGHARITRTLGTEQTQLLTRWFRCVKLPTGVLAKAHPLYNLAMTGHDERVVPHLFFADPDGGNFRGVHSAQTQSGLWRVMMKYLQRSYEEKASEALSGMRKLLSQYDMIDVAEVMVRDRIAREIKRNGPKSSGLKKLQADLDKLAGKRSVLLARQAKLQELSLKAAVVAPPDPISGVK